MAIAIAVYLAALALVLLFNHGANRKPTPKPQTRSEAADDGPAVTP